MLETGINIIEWPLLQYCAMIALGGDALQRKIMSHKLSFIIIDTYTYIIQDGYCVNECLSGANFMRDTCDEANCSAKVS